MTTGIERASCESCAHGVPKDVAHRGEQVSLVQWAGTESPLEQVAAGALAEVDSTRAGLVGLADAFGETGFCTGDSDQVYVVQAPSGVLKAGLLAVVGEKAEVVLAIRVYEEDLLRADSALHNMVRSIR